MLLSQGNFFFEEKPIIKLSCLMEKEDVMLKGLTYYWKYIIFGWIQVEEVLGRGITIRN